MSRTKTLRAQITDLRLALSLLHSGWKVCPWCGKRKHPAARCPCPGWTRAETELPPLIDERRSRRPGGGAR